ncbi:hypothetical protein AUJ17_04135 [Candidatus Micrarchaeota archaeon CG1_02_47_40]|nr:MAG: hypothetical protein AUJ17_04135 [Candidatus Micrarchaeota archaeon CG1_02_47_40]QBM01425.1 hypothetical protein [uncultured archaeon]
MENKHLIIAGALAVVIVLVSVLLLGGESQTPVDGKVLKEKFDAAVEKVAQMKKNGCEVSEAQRLLQETRNAYVQGDLSSATAILAQTEETIRNVDCPGAPPIQPPANKTNQTWNGTLKTNSDSIPKYSKFEISLKSPKTYSNPFDPEVVAAEAHFTTPSGKDDIAYGFWYQEYEVKKETVQKNGKSGVKEVYSPVGEPFWMFRYAPAELGKYMYYITIEEGSAASLRYPQSGKMEFNAVESSSTGYIKVSEKSPQYFAFENGGTFFGIGRGPHDVFASLAKNIETHKSYGMNMIQCEFEAPFGMEHEKLGEYDLEMAYQGDLAVERAEELGVYLQMVLTHFSNWVDTYTLPPEAGLQEFEEGLFQMWRDSPYNKKNGGVIEYPGQYFTDENAKRYAKNRMRYYIARWGYSTHAMSWQFWGELDNVWNLASEEGRKHITPQGMTGWLSEMGAYIKSLDTRHLVTANINQDYDPSDSGTKWKEDMWHMETIDYITSHDYSLYNEMELPDEIGYYYDFGKPIVVQEYPCNNNMEVCQHNLVWRLSLNGLAATPMKFSYDDGHDEYTVFADFIRGLDTAEYETGLADAEDLTPEEEIQPLVVPFDKKGTTATFREGGYISPVKVYGISNKKQAYLWVHDITHNSVETSDDGRLAEVAKYSSKTIQNAKFRLSGMENGAYSIEFFDTWEGKVVSSSQLDADGGSLTIEVPAFKKDIAVRITKK